ncbi:hypothetical protein F5Y06DRAFT_303018 [Hypoxylon sp. FL0890]|nr:hypothetical protein F5Y06DRAFT_303018 [Hypoxylon sp. FL0890]
MHQGGGETILPRKLRVSPIRKLPFAIRPTGGGAQYPWGNARIIALFVVFGVLGIVFSCLAEGSSYSTFAHSEEENILGGVWYGVCMGAAPFVFSYYLPIWFQAVKGVSATGSSLMNLPSILGLVIFINGGGLATALDMHTPLLIASSVITAVGSGLLSRLFRSSSIFLGVAQTVFQNQVIKNLAASAPEVNSTTDINNGVTALRNNVPPDQLPAVLQAYNDSIAQTFYVAVAVSTLSIVGPIFMD